MNKETVVIWKRNEKLKSAKLEAPSKRRSLTTSIHLYPY